MIVGIDIHGVLDTYTADVLDFIKRVREENGNNSIYIITGPPEEQAKAELKKLGLKPNVHYDKVISVVDYLRQHLEEHDMWTDKNGHWWCADKYWWCSKARICTEYKVDILFDDSEKYLIGWDATNCKTEFWLVTNDKHIERKR